VSDFLVRLAGRALRQTPVLEPLVASLHAPLEVSSPLAPEHEAEVHRSARGAPALPPPATVRLPAEAEDVAVAALSEPPLPNRSQLSTRMTVQTPTRRASDPVTDVGSAIAPEVVDSTEPVLADAAPGAVVVDHPSGRPAHHTRTEEDQAKAGTALPPQQRFSSPAIGALRESAVVRDTTRRELAGARVEPTPPAADEPTVRQRSVRHAQAAQGAATERSNVEHPRGEIELRHEVHEPAEPATITVTIGRIEVRAAPGEPRVQPRVAEPRPGPRVSLDDYLTQRSGSQR
jgi:hypothetical protein